MGIDRDTDRAVSRRGILTIGAGAAGVAVLAACSGGSADSAGGRGTDVAPPDPTPTTGPADASVGAESSSSAPGRAANGRQLVALDDLDVGSSTAVTLASGKPAIVTRTGTATAVCHSAVCTHMGCTVKPKGRRLDCPCHGSSFDASTGKVLGGPAPSPLPRVAVAVAGGAVTEA